MKTLSFINLKGGVGKTTIATNLAYLVRSHGGCAFSSSTMTSRAMLHAGLVQTRKREHSPTF